MILISIPAGVSQVSRRIVVMIVFSFVVVISGCWSSERNIKPYEETSVPLLKPEDEYRYEGKGKNKHKVSLSPQEKKKLRFQARKKLEAE